MSLRMMHAPAPALAIALVLLAATPAAAFTPVLNETVEAIPDAESVQQDVHEAAAACRDAPGAACAEGANDRANRHVKSATAPALAWASALAADPAGTLTALASDFGAYVDRSVAGWNAWIDARLQDLGITRPDA